mgnify:CR=1 FL=1
MLESGLTRQKKGGNREQAKKEKKATNQIPKITPYVDSREGSFANLFATMHQKKRRKLIRKKDSPAEGGRREPLTISHRPNRS